MITISKGLVRLKEKWAMTYFILFENALFTYCVYKYNKTEQLFFL